LRPSFGYKTNYGIRVWGRYTTDTQVTVVVNFHRNLVAEGCRSWSIRIEVAIRHFATQQVRGQRRVNQQQRQ
jgi:hypothetical protein